MKRKKVDSKTEEKIITAMITSKEFLVQIAPSLDIDLFSADHFRTIANWCKKYFNKYQKAPEHHIENIFHSWEEKGKAKEETVDAVSDILEKLSGNYEQEKCNNIPYLLDEASNYLSMRKIEQLRDNLEFSLLEGDPSIAESTINSFRTVKTGLGMDIDTLRDKNAWENAYSQSQKPLFTVGAGGVKNFFAQALCRDNLIGILGPEKRGKTFWCVELAIRALMHRRKVALFEVGDMSESQILKRIGTRFANVPMFQYQCNKKIEIPTKILDVETRRDQNRIIRTYEMDHIYKTYEKPATAKMCLEAIAKFMRKFGISSEHTFLMTSIHPNYSVNVHDINNILDRWEIEHDFIPDVIIIDYGDILADEPDTNNYVKRDKENVKWMMLRRLSQEKHNLVIVPTQADALSYEQDTLGMGNFSEDKRKLGHVTGMFGLNQTPEEKEMNIMRLNWIVLREGEAVKDRFLYVGQQLKLGRAYCCGYY